MKQKHKTKGAERTLFSNTIMLYIMKLSGYVFPLLTFPYLTRVLDPAGYGLVTYSDSIMTYFMLLVDFGFLLSATRSCALNRDDKAKLSDIGSAATQAKFFLAAGGFLILAVLVLTVDVFREMALFLVLSYLSVFLNAFIPDFLFRGLERMDQITYRFLLSRLIYTASIFVFIHSPSDYLWIPILNMVTNVFIVVWSWMILIRKFDIHPRVVPFKLMWESLRESLPYFFSRIATTAYSSTNVLLLGFYFNTSQLAMFTAPNNLITKGRGMFSPISDSIYPYMVKSKNYKLLKKILLILMPLIFAGCVVLFIFADFFVELLCGSQYADAVPVFRAMIPLLFLTLPIYLLGFPTLGALGLIKETNLTTIYAAVFHVIGLGILILTGHLTFIAVSILTCVSECIVLGTRIYYLMIGLKRKRLETIHEKTVE